MRDSRSEAHTDTYDARTAPGSNTLRGVVPDAVIARMRTVASGVRVMLVSVADMRLMTTRGGTSEDAAVGSKGRAAARTACARDAPLDRRGKLRGGGGGGGSAFGVACDGERKCNRE